MKPLPLNCTAFYRANFLDPTEALALFHEIITEFDVTNKVVKMADGGEHRAETGSYIFADPELTSFDALSEVWGGRSPWTTSLAHVRDRIEAEVGIRFPVARCIYYQDGSEGVDFHRDLPAYGSTATIASLSLGAERDFVFRSVADPNERFTIRLSSGSLLLMGEGCQELYEHSLPRDASCREARLNLTFRLYGFA